MVTGVLPATVSVQGFEAPLAHAVGAVKVPARGVMVIDPPSATV